MKKLILFFIVIICFTAHSQSKSTWTKRNSKENINIYKGVQRASFPTIFDLYDLDIVPMRTILFSNTAKKIISLPNVDGQIEEFEMVEASNFDPALQAQFPEIRAYSGKGITDKFASLKLSISPQGIQTMIFRTDKPNEFIECYADDRKTYAVFKSQRDRSKLDWTCTTNDVQLDQSIDSKVVNFNRSSTGQLKTMRLAQSCTAEYANYFGATSSADVALVLAAFNATLTRCNGCYEKDLGLHLNLIAETVNVIFYDAATDPYAAAAQKSQWNTQLQIALNTTLSTGGIIINNGLYDIGHLFGASGGGGNAGCIGCVCVDGVAAGTGTTKGRGITSPPTGSGPLGDNFDIDYVVHEVGHQLGGNHTFSHSTEGTGVNKEVGSGITIMGYAGITSYDIAAHSIDIYHEATIAQIQANLATKTCPVTTNISADNATPVAMAGLDYTIPISTPFALTGAATDANAGDAITYCWEQNDDCGSSTGANSTALVTKTVGPNFTSWSPTASPTRYCPKMATVLLNAQTTAQVGGDAGKMSEALSSVARTLNFRLTVRDNVPYSSVAPIVVGQTAFDDMRVTVSAASTPFTVTSQNTAGVTYAGLTNQLVSWNVGTTTAAPFNAANVKISLSTDNLNFSTVLLSNTPNDGSEMITIPDFITATTCRIKVEAVENIFFNVNTTQFTIMPSLGTSSFDLSNFKLYPNPNNGSFSLQFNSNSGNDIEIAVHDIQGRLIFNKKYPNYGLFSQIIQLENVASSVYLLTIADGNNKVVKRIVVE